MDIAKSVFTNYNKIISKSYDRFFQGLIDNNNSKDVNIEPTKMMEIIETECTKWLSTPLKELNNHTPQDYFENISSATEALAIWKEAIQCCDHNLPDVFMKKFKAFGNEAEDVQIQLLTMNSADLKNMDETQRTILISAIRLAGEWEINRAVPITIDICLRAQEDDDLLLETCRTTLSQIGKASIKPLMDVLEGLVGPNYNERYEQLLLALAEAGSKNKSEELYRVIKNAFKEIPNKLVGSDCIAKYNDAKGIPVLRGYLERNINTLEAHTFYEVKSAIQRLGGQTDDLVDLYMSLHGK